MRLDKFLKLSRIIKRRTIAKDILDIGLVKINGKIAKPSTEVKEEDVLELTLGERILVVKVKKIIQNPGKKDSIAMFEIVSDK